MDADPGRDPDVDPDAVARAIALRQLALAPRTRAELASTLHRRGVPADVAERVLDRLEAVDLVDDEEFARQWVQTRHAGRGLARRALRYELQRRGVADDVVHEAVDQVDDEQELAAAIGLVRRRLPSMVRDDPVRRYRRLAGMLARKGHGAEVIRRALAEAVGSPEPSDRLGQRGGG